MPESSLALSYDEIRMRVADHRGYGLDSDKWDADQRERIDFCLRDGSRTFYTQANHEWSFLEPLAQMTIASGASELELPWDFGFITDDIYFEERWGHTIRIRSDGEVLVKRQHDSVTSARPLIAAVVPAANPEINHGQKFKLIFWPTAASAYVVNIRYAITPNALTPQTPFPYGGAVHAQTILEACLAASERVYGVPGMHNQIYAIALEQSKIHDRRLKPRTLGYNSNGPRGIRWQPRNMTPVTFS